MYNDHPWNPIFVVVVVRWSCSEVVIIRRWSLFGGGRYSEVVVSSGLRIQLKPINRVDQAYSVLTILFEFISIEPNSVELIGRYQLSHIRS